MTVGELKEILSEYKDDALIYMEPVNVYNRSVTMWSQQALDTYPCYDRNNRRALMIVGSIR